MEDFFSSFVFSMLFVPITFLVILSIITIFAATLVIALLPKLHRGYRSFIVRLLSFLAMFTPAFMWALLQLTLLAVMRFSAFQLTEPWQGIIYVILWSCLVITCVIGIFVIIKKKFSEQFIPSIRNRIFFAVMYSLTALIFLRYLLIGLGSFVLLDFGKIMFFFANN